MSLYFLSFFFLFASVSGEDTFHYCNSDTACAFTSLYCKTGCTVYCSTENSCEHSTIICGNTCQIHCNGLNSCQNSVFSINSTIGGGIHTMCNNTNACQNLQQIHSNTNTITRNKIECLIHNSNSCNNIKITTTNRNSLIWKCDGNDSCTNGINNCDNASTCVNIGNSVSRNSNQYCFGGTTNCTCSGSASCIFGTATPTISPTFAPIDPPTSAPTPAPVIIPTSAPIEPPTDSPTPAPTNSPTNNPTQLTISPTLNTLNPTINPTNSDKNGSDSLSQTSLIFIIIMSLALVISIILVGIFIIKKRRRNSKVENSLDEHISDSNRNSIFEMVNKTSNETPDGNETKPIEQPQQVEVPRLHTANLDMYESDLDDNVLASDTPLPRYHYSQTMSVNARTPNSTIRNENVESVSNIVSSNELRKETEDNIDDELMYVINEGDEGNTLRGDINNEGEGNNETSNGLNALEWTVSDVVDWLQNILLLPKECYEKFEENEIDGQVLLSNNFGDHILRELTISKIGYRVKILDGIQKLKNGSN